MTKHAVDAKLVCRRKMQKETHMAKVNKITGRVVKKKPTFKRISKRGLQAPGFEGWENMSGHKFHIVKRQNSNFWYMNYKHNENIEHCFKWMKQAGYDKETINNVKKSAKYESYLGIYCKMLLDGCPDYNEKENDYWQACPGAAGDIKPISEFIEKKIKHHNEIGKGIAEEKKATTKNVYIPSIQDRLQEAAGERTEELDQWLDDWMRDPKANPLKNVHPIQLFKKKEINIGHLRFVTNWFAGGYEELQELANLPSPKNRTDMQEQLAEGYSSYSKAQIKELTDFYKRLNDAIDIIKAEQKQNRAVRKPKVKSAQELVKKLKFKPSDGDFGIASINPSEVIDATAIVVFNTKNRKIGIYYAEDHTQFKVKGTTLLHFSETKSLQRTVRKPDEVLPQWKKVTKHKLKSQFGYLKTTETKMNGRFNADTIILKAFK